ncbi:MAG: AAA family ATPase [Pseudomonadota bacterium]
MTIRPPSPRSGESARNPVAQRGGQRLQEIFDELYSLVGLQSVKEEFYGLYNFARVVSQRKQRDMPVSNLTFHMVFTGPPGTGKTTVARYVGELLYELKLLRKNKLIEVDRSKLVGTHLGDTAKIVTDTVKEALDGVLFIDEAYTLAGGGGPTSNTDPYGQEAIDTLLKHMEDHRERLVVIFAGYSGEMRRFVDANPGLQSRIAKTIEFPSYGGDELFAIFKRLVDTNHLILTGDAEHEAEKLIRDIASAGKKDENFGNARVVRQVFEALQPIQAQRISEETEDLDAISDDALMTITDQDIQIYESRR